RLQLAGAAVDRVGVHGERLGADRRVQEAPVRAHRHRHDQVCGLGARARLQLAAVEQAVCTDVAVLGIRYIDEGRRLRRHAESERQHYGEYAFHCLLPEMWTTHKHYHHCGCQRAYSPSAWTMRPPTMVSSEWIAPM